MTSAQIIIIVTIVLYLAAMVFVGVYFGKKGSGGGSDDFYLGGRKMGPIVTAMSAEASDMSSYLLMGLPGLAYLCGLPEVTSGPWHVSQLADHRAPPAPVFGQARRHHDPRLFCPPLRRSEASALLHRGGRHPHFLHPLHGVRL